MQESKDEDINYRDIVLALKSGFEDVFNISLNTLPFSQKEEVEIDSLIKTKYRNEKWLKKYL